MQKNLDKIAEWTKNNLMKLNEAKCHYMIFSRSKVNFATRLKLNDKRIDQVNVSKLLGVWISQDLTWSRNCQEISRKAYSRVSMLTKLKYAGVSIEDLINIYILYIRSITEYCAVVFHPSLTQENIRKLETIQKTCLKVILGEMYVSYSSALEMCGLQTLFQRRQNRCLDFARKCTQQPKLKNLFPLNPETSSYEFRRKEIFKINFAHTSRYRQSTIPFCQRLLNDYYSKED